MTNQYHIIDKIPIYEDQYGMEVEYENLAKLLVDSGKMRIDDVLKSNFVRFIDPKTGQATMFSDIELSNPEMLKNTKEVIKSILGEKANLEQEIEKLNYNLKKRQSISQDLLQQIARIFVQSSHPIATLWLLIEKVEVFISFSHNIGDMMDIHNWKQNGQNSGMQSTNGRDVAIFVSCGGDPFGEVDLEHPEYGDGGAAIARMQIVAGQEVGHYTDIMRDDNGKQISRHSADFAATKAKEHVRVGRIKDIERCEVFLREMDKRGLNNLIRYESILTTYKQNNIKGIRRAWLRLMAFFYKIPLKLAASKHHWYFVRRFMKDEKPGSILRGMCQDMKFNLAPQADVYVGRTQEETEAIACVEALARVPQQVIKWGHLATEYFMRDLYHIYYGEVIPSLIDKYEKVTGEKYIRNKAIIRMTIFLRLKRWWQNFRGVSSKVLFSREIV